MLVVGVPALIDQSCEAVVASPNRTVPMVRFASKVTLVAAVILSRRKIEDVARGKRGQNTAAPICRGSPRTARRVRPGVGRLGLCGVFLECPIQNAVAEIKPAKLKRRTERPIKRCSERLAMFQ